MKDAELSVRRTFQKWNKSVGQGTCNPLSPSDTLHGLKEQ